MNISSIKNWSIDDRPREKLIEKGARSLSNAELLAILLGSGSKNESAVDLAKRILNYSQNNLSDIGRLAEDDRNIVESVHDAGKSIQS